MAYWKRAPGGGPGGIADNHLSLKFPDGDHIKNSHYYSTKERGLSRDLSKFLRFWRGNWAGKIEKAPSPSNGSGAGGGGALYGDTGPLGSPPIENVLVSESAVTFHPP